MGSGKVNYDKLHEQLEYRKKTVRWRTLRCFENGAAMRMFGYAVTDSKTGKKTAWFGHPEGHLDDVPCSHCGQVNVFVGDAWRHHCPGVLHGGVACPLLEDHLCRGEPSMANAPMWKSSDFWEEET